LAPSSFVVLRPSENLSGVQEIFFGVVIMAFDVYGFYFWIIGDGN